MWNRNYEVLRAYSSLPAYKFTSDYTESQRPFYLNTSGARAYLNAATDNDSTRLGNLMNYNWVTTYFSSIGNNQATLEVGSDGTAAAASDYALKSIFTTSSITKTIVEIGTPKLDIANHKWTQKVSIDFKNITANDIIIKEWGVFIHPTNFVTICIKRETLTQTDWKTVPANSYCRIDFEYEVEMPTALENYNLDTITDTWAEIVANANAGTVEGYNVGDTKTLEFDYDGKHYIAQAKIVGKAHDTISGSEDKAALSWLLEPIVWTHNMNATNTNSGGWMAENGDVYDDSLDLTDGELTHGCAMRKFVYSLLAGFPELLQNNIKTVDKLYDDDTTIRTSKEKLWIPSLIETGLTASYARAGQGVQYAAFSNNASRVKNSMGIGQYWWSRSRYTNNSYNFYYVTSDGSAINGTASTVYGCALGFCL